MNAQPSSHVLVVEDEPDIAALVAYQLAHAGYRVRTAAGGAEALRLIDSDPPDLLVLDLMLPQISGVEVLKTLRAREDTRGIPVIILTARGAEDERVRGFELGADDYVSKPFSPKELVARVGAVLRRTSAGGSSRTRGRLLRGGPVQIDTGANLVTVDGKEVKLTPKEYRLLTCLLERRGRTQSRTALLEAVWETTARFETRTIDMHVGRLRSKLGAAGDYIETVRGFGYRFRRED